jgi:beta-galactosidase
MDQLLAYYRPLWRAGIAVDIVHPGGDLSGYDLVVAPQLYLVNDHDARNLRGLVERGGVLLLGPFSGVADVDAHIRLGRFPVPFADLVGGSGEEYCPLPDAGIPVCSGTLGDFTATVWGERLRLDDGEGVATFAGGDLDGLPAVLRRRAPSGGEAWYVGTIPPQAVLAEIVARCARSAGVVGVTGLVPGVGSQLPDGVEAVRRGDVLFLFNTTSAEREVALPDLHRDLLTGAEFTGTVSLGPEDALALIERTI